MIYYIIVSLILIPLSVLGGLYSGEILGYIFYYQKYLGYQYARIKSRFVYRK